MTDDDIEARLVIIQAELDRLRRELARAWTEIYRLQDDTRRASTPLDLRGRLLPTKEPR